jgi:hypothetical protein
MALTIMKDHGALTYGSGKLAEVRVIKGSARYTSTFTPELTSLQNLSGTSFLLNSMQGIGSFLTDSASNLIPTIVGSPTSSSDHPSPLGSILMPGANNQTITIPAATSVAYPVGTTITFIAGPSASTVTIAITTDTMYLTGTGTTGSRTLAAHGMATAVKVSGTSSSGVWYINGSGLT